MRDLDDARYILLTTYKKDGSPAATPVWITGSGGHYVFTTGDKAWKTIGLGRNPNVRVQVCGARGRVRPGTSAYDGTAQVNASIDAIATAERALAAKYGWQFAATKLVDRFKARFGRGPAQRVVAIELSIGDA